MKRNPELSSVRQIEWQLFCTFTFRGASQTSPQKVRMLFAWLRQCAANSGIHFKKLLWCVRSERGEATGRHHYHALIGGLPSRPTKANCFFLMNKWETLGGGMSRIYPFEATLDGVEYVFKGLEQAFNAAQSRTGASEYELNKFGGSCDVTLSESLIRYLLHKSRYGMRDKGTRSDEQAEGDRHAIHTEQSVVR